MIDKSANRGSKKAHLITASEGVGGVKSQKAKRLPEGVGRTFSCLFRSINLPIIPLLSDEGILEETTLTLASSEWIIVLCSRVKG